MKNKAKKVGLYDPYLDTLGGGEKHILSVLKVFAEQGYNIDIFCDKNLSKEISDRFLLSYVNKIKFLASPFKNGTSPLQNFITLRAYDYFFYVTDGSYFFSSAKKNFVFAMVPNKHLYNKNVINKLKLSNYQFISNSPYTAGWLKRWGVQSTVILPYIDSKLIEKNNYKKEKIILSVGRFFPHLHSKNQESIIKVFKKLKNKSKEFSNYKLVLAGGLKKEDQLYFNSLKELAKNDSSIVFKINVPRFELHKLYEQSTYFWHFTGFGIDENINPDKVEHLGISPLEAMASGCLVFCYKAGGPKELIKDGENGFLFSNIDELINKMIKINSNNSLKEKVYSSGKLFVKKNFSYEIFKEKVLKLL